jgi:hypothetical protein
MRRKLSLAVTLVMVFAVVPTASALPISFGRWPLDVFEPGSLLLLGIVFLLLASVARRAFSPASPSGSGADTTG